MHANLFFKCCVTWFAFTMGLSSLYAVQVQTLTLPTDLQQETVSLREGTLTYLSVDHELKSLPLVEGAVAQSANLSFENPSALTNLLSSSNQHWAWNDAEVFLLNSDNQTITAAFSAARLVLDEADQAQLLAKGTSDDWRVGAWSDNLTVWQEQSTSLQTDNGTPWTLEAMSDHEVILSTLETRSRHHRIDSAGVWLNASLGAPAGEKVVFAQHRKGIDLRLLQSSTAWFIETSLDGGTTWKRISITDFDQSTTFLCAQWRRDGNLDLLDVQGKWIQYSPEELINWSQLFLRENAQGLTLSWPEFPWTTQYRVLQNGSILSSSVGTETQVDLAALPEEGTVYVVEALLNNTWTTGPTATFQRGLALSWSMFHASSNAGSAYAMISVPGGAFVLDEDQVFSPLSYLEAFLGPEHHPANWRLGHYSPARLAYEMGTDITSFLPTSSYWILSAWNISYTVQGFEPKSDQAVVMLKPGWNMIGTPYNETSTLLNMEVLDGMRQLKMSQWLDAADPAMLPSIWTWSNGSYVQSDELVPSVGGWVQNRRFYDIYLVISNARALQKAGRAAPALNARQKAQKTRWASSASPPAPPSGLATSASSASGGSGGGCLLR